MTRCLSIYVGHLTKKGQLALGKVATGLFDVTSSLGKIVSPASESRNFLITYSLHGLSIWAGFLQLTEA